MKGDKAERDAAIESFNKYRKRNQATINPTKNQLQFENILFEFYIKGFFEGSKWRKEKK